MKCELSKGFISCLLLALAAPSAYSATPSAGCGTPGLTSGTYTMQHGRLTRTFRVHVPSGYDMDDPARLAVVFHGWGGNENEFLDNPVVLAGADHRGYILVAPRGRGSEPPDFRLNSWSFRGSRTGLDGDGVNPDVPADTNAICDDKLTADYSYPSCAPILANTCAWTHCQDRDVDFALALVEHIGANLCVDQDNVFASGGSNGGMFAWELGQNPASAPTFRAIAPLIGLPHRGFLNRHGKNADMPVLLITGENDATVPPGAWEDPSYTTTFDGDKFFYTGATGITKAWATAHGCNTQSDAVAFDDGIQQTDCRTYCADDNGWPRVLDCRAPMGHAYQLRWSWRLILRFFDQHAVE